MQELFSKYGLVQSDLTRALGKWEPPIGRSYAHYIWHGTKPPSMNVLLAIRQAFPEIRESDLVEAVAQARAQVSWSMADHLPVDPPA